MFEERVDLVDIFNIFDLFNLFDLVNLFNIFDLFEQGGGANTSRPRAWAPFGERLQRCFPHSE